MCGSIDEETNTHIYARKVPIFPATHKEHREDDPQS